MAGKRFFQTFFTYFRVCRNSFLCAFQPLLFHDFYVMPPIVAYKMAVRLHSHGATITFSLRYDGYSIAVRWQFNHTAIKKPSYHLDKAMILR